MREERRRIERRTGERRSVRADIMRADLDALRDQADRNSAAIGRLETELFVQFKRIAQLQAELDEVKRQQSSLRNSESQA